jgi:hypothetical protein
MLSTSYPQFTPFWLHPHDKRTITARVGLALALTHSQGLAVLGQFRLDLTRAIVFVASRYAG